MSTISNLIDKIESFGRISEKNSITPYNVAILLLDLLELADTRYDEDLIQIRNLINNKISEVKSKNLELEDFIKSLRTRLNSLFGDSDESDFSISDSNGYDIVSFLNGHIFTKKFNSAEFINQLQLLAYQLDEEISARQSHFDSLGDTIIELQNNIKHPVVVDNEPTNEDFAISDKTGNDIVRFSNGHISTKFFNSANLQYNSNIPIAISNTVESSDNDFTVTDRFGYDILRVSDGHIKTKNFDSSAIESHPANDIRENNKDGIEKAIIPVMGSSDLCLLCFNDIHGDSTNLARLLLWRSQYSSYVNDTICIGDMCNINSTENFAWFNNSRIMTTIGNHDIYTSGTSGDLGESGCFNRYMAGIASWGVQYTSGKCYYYKDYAKVRLIVIDCMHWNNAQSDWLTTTLASARAADKAVLVASHYPLGAWNGIDCPFNIKDAFNTSYSTNTTPTAISEFISAGGKFIAYLCGHTHNDVIGTLKNHSNQLMLTFDSATPRPENVEVHSFGTKSQDCATLVGVDTTRKLLMLYRIGCSTDRYLRSKRILTINYETKNIITSI